MKKILHAPELYIALLLVILGGLLYWGFSSIEDVRYERGGNWKNGALPFSEFMSSGEHFVVEMKVRPGFFDDYSLKVNPDDCVDAFFVNDTRIRVDSIPGHCDWNTGFSIPSELIESAASGSDLPTLRWVMHNGGGPGGISLVLNASGYAGTILQVLFLVLLGVLFVMILYRFHWNTGLALLFALGFLLRLLYIQDTFYDSRGHDVGGHLSYVRIIAEANHIPSATECWTCYHPPVYYVTVTPTWKLANVLDLSPQRFLQWDSFVFSILTLGLGLLCLQMFLSGGALGIASLLWVIWPSVILGSPRIGNDVFFYLAHILCLWSCLRYLVSHKGSYLLVGVLACWLSVWTKTTGVVTIGIWGLTVLLGYFPRNRIRPTKSEAISAILFVALVGTLVVVHRGGALVGNAGGLSDSVAVGNSPSNYLFFDFRTFLTEPYTSPFNDAQGRQYFWNYLAKTSLFGEFELLKTTAGMWLSSIISLCFLGLSFFAFVGFWKMKMSKMHLLILGQGFLFLGAMLVFRMQYPFSCSNDFRYIVPILLSFVPFVGQGIFTENASHKRLFVGIFTAVLFAICSFSLLVLL